MYQKIELTLPAHFNHPSFFDEYLIDIGLFCADSCEVDMSFTIPKNCKRATARFELSDNQVIKLDKLVYSFCMTKEVILRCIFNDMHWKPSKYQSIPAELQQSLDYDLIKKHKNLPNYHHLGRDKRNAKKNK